MLLGASLYEIFDECLNGEHNVVQSFNLAQLVDKRFHRALALSEFHLPVLAPEVVVAHLSIRVLEHGLTSAQQLLGYLIEGIVAATSGTHHNKLGEELGYGEFNKHIVERHLPLPSRKLRELLHALHVLNPVDIAGLGDGHLATAHLIGRVGKYEDLSTKAEVLLVVRSKVELEAAILSHHDGVSDIEAVELYGILSNGAGERILEQAYIVFVEVDIGEDVLHSGVDDIARLEQVVHTS